MKSTSFYSENKKMIWLLVISFLVRIAIFIRFRPWNEDIVKHQILIFDSLGYHHLALCVRHFSFCNETFRTPAYPFFLAIVYSLTESAPYTAIFAQIFFNLFSIFLMYRIGKELFGEKVGFIAALLFSIDLHHTIFIYYILTESIYTTVFLAALLYFFKGIKDDRIKPFIISGILFGISTLIRPISQYYIMGLVLFMVLWYFKRWKNTLKFASIIALTYFLTVAPWCYRNYSTFGYFQLSNIKGYSFLFWDASYYMAKKQHKKIENVNKEFYAELRTMGWTPTGNPFDNEKYMLTLANKIIAPHFADYLKTHLIGTVKIHLSLGTQSLTDVLHIPAKKFTEEEKYTNGVFVLVQKFFAQKTIYEIVLGLIVALFLFVVYLFAIAGSWKLFREKKVLLMLFFLGSAGYFTLISGIVSYARYRLPSMPFYILLASVGIAYISERNRNRDSKF